MVNCLLQDNLQFISVTTRKELGLFNGFRHDLLFKIVIETSDASFLELRYIVSSNYEKEFWFYNKLCSFLKFYFMN